jgi:hypothetical protein
VRDVVGDGKLTNSRTGAIIEINPRLLEHPQMLLAPEVDDAFVAIIRVMLQWFLASDGLSLFLFCSRAGFFSCSRRKRR